MLVLLTSLCASAASLDFLEVGGAYGTPGATDGAAVWWNPAGMAAEPGTRLHLEVAPVIASVKFDREDPFGRGGPDRYDLIGAVPYLGVVSDLGVPGLGIGVGAAVPYARGGKERDEPGTGRFAMRTGNSQTITLMAGGAYNIAERVQIGGVVHTMLNTWTANVDTETATALDREIAALGQDSGYTDATVEDPNYAATLVFDNLHDVRVSFSAGVRAVLVPDKLALSASYLHGTRVVNTGGLEVRFGCPPQDDTLGRFGAEAFGLCNATLAANGVVAYDLPSRINAGLEIRPTETVRVELMGGWVGWSRYTDFDIEITDVENLNELKNEEAADLVNQHRLWARANHDSYWLGTDAKVDVGDRITVGARVSYDHAAVPIEALSPNNFDASTVVLGAMFAARPHDRVQLLVSATYHIAQTRTVTDSAYAVTLEGPAKDDRWFYPQMNGTYRSSILRLGAGVRLYFGKIEDRRSP